MSPTIFFDILGYFEISVFEITTVHCPFTVILLHLETMDEIVVVETNSIYLDQRAFAFFFQTMHVSI